ncbi:hypothetical protein, partial [Anaerobutyricum hallii]|uniref:hypothetical protein n=1 Tax=Anaerobutyricum hallii TaxID=39488 RepID=UPI003AB58582
IFFIHCIFSSGEILSIKNAPFQINSFIFFNCLPKREHTIVSLWGLLGNSIKRMAVHKYRVLSLFGGVFLPAANKNLTT